MLATGCQAASAGTGSLSHGFQSNHCSCRGSLGQSLKDSFHPHLGGQKRWMEEFQFSLLPTNMSMEQKLT